MTPDVLREKFNSGMTYAEFRQSTEAKQRTLDEIYDYSETPSDVQATFEALVARYGGEVNVLAIAEDWCGDAIRAFPVLARLEDVVDGLTVRIQLSEAPENEALAKGWPRGDSHPIPIIVFLDKDFEEIGHWLERMKGGYELRAKLEEEHKDLKGRAYAKVAGPIVFAAFKESHWKDTLDEWAEVLNVKQTQST